MDDIKQQFKSYFRAGNGGIITGIFLLVVAIGIIVVPRVLPSFIYTEKNAVKFDAVDPSLDGKYTYIDIVGIDDYSASKGKDYYYLVLDTDNTMDIVQMSPSVYNSLTEQQEYMQNRGDEEATVPEPYRIYGVTHKISDELMSTVASTYNQSTAVMAKYVGGYYLTNKASFSKNILEYTFIGGVMVAIAGIAIAADNVSKNKNINKTLSRLEVQGTLLAAWNELQTYLQSNPKSPYILTDNYLVTQNGVVARYEDILWAYEFVRKRNFVTVARYVICKLNDGSSAELISKKVFKKEEVQQTLDALGQKNPNMLMGFDVENQRVYKQMIQK